MSVSNDDALEHYGVKGMHWGVRKARTGDLNKRASRNERVASGNASVVDHIITFNGSSARNLKKSGGYKKEAARRAANKRAEIERLATGKAKALDILKAYGTVTSTSLARSLHKKSDFEL